MRTTTRTLTAIFIAAALGGTALAGAGYAKHRDRNGLGFPDTWQLELTAMEVFDTIDADGDGTLTQTEIDSLRNDRHARHDANGDGNLSLEEFSGPLARDHAPVHRARLPVARYRR